MLADRGGWALIVIGLAFLLNVSAPPAVSAEDPFSALAYAKFQYECNKAKNFEKRLSKLTDDIRKYRKQLKKKDCYTSKVMFDNKALADCHLTEILLRATEREYHPVYRQGYFQSYRCRQAEQQFLDIATESFYEKLDRHAAATAQSAAPTTTTREITTQKRRRSPAGQRKKKKWKPDWSKFNRAIQQGRGIAGNSPMPGLLGR